MAISTTGSTTFATVIAGIPDILARKDIQIGNGASPCLISISVDPPV